MENKSSSGKGVLYITFSELFFYITSYATYFFLGRSFDPKDFGIFGIVVFFVSMINTVLTTAFQQTISKFVSQEPHSAKDIRRKSFLAVFIMSLILTVLYFSFSKPLSSILHDATLVSYIRLSSLLILPSSFFHAFVGYLNGLKKFKRQAILVMIYSALRLGLVMTMVMLGFSIKGVIIALVLAPLLILAISLLSDMKLSEKTVSNIMPKNVFRFAYPLMLFTILLNLFMNLDLFMIKSLSQTAVANINSGYYTAASTLARVPYFLVTGLSFVLFPIISESTYNKKKERTLSQISTSLRYCLFALVPVSFITASTTTELVHLVYSRKYQGAVMPLSILVFGMGFFALFIILTTIISGSGRPVKSFLISLPLVIIDFVLNAILIRRYSLTGAAVATTVASFLGFIIAAIYVSRKFGAFIKLASLVKMLLSGAIIFLISRLYAVFGIFLLVKYAVLLSLYVSLLMILKEINKKDIDFFRSLLP
ncbi:oligosaccharide flippase family protein [Candidatus Woesearchaeota archaeon]|nr:oligosaccharide flippase family protein [Candidatus Woesearchaeota archaeon]